jgi:hypothetical protein
LASTEPLDGTTGELGLKEPLSRSFRTPSIANVTKLATTNIGIKNLIVEGSEPLTVTEAFRFTAEDCRFINDTSIGGKNVIDYNLNTLNGFRFLRNEFISVGPGYAPLLFLGQLACARARKQRNQIPKKLGPECRMGNAERETSGGQAI